MQIRSAKLGELYALMKKELEDVYPEQEGQNLIQILLSHISGYSRSEIILRKDEDFSIFDNFCNWNYSIFAKCTSRAYSFNHYRKINISVL